MTSPIGIYFPSLDALPAIKQAGFDYFVVWSQDDPWPFINYASQLGLKAVIDVRGREYLIGQIGDHPSVLGYYIADEPGTWAECYRLQSVYSTWKLLTSKVIFIANLPWMADDALWRALLDIGDVACIDIYPKYDSNVVDYDQIPNGIKAARQAVPNKPLWYIAPAFEGGGFVKLTPDEYRQVVSLAIANGASGLLVFTWASQQITGGMGVTDTDPLWPTIAEVNHQLKQSVASMTPLVVVFALAAAAKLLG